MAAKELVEYVAKSLVDDPDAVKVEVVREEGGTVIELHVAEEDMGKVIGRNGSVAKALLDRVGANNVGSSYVDLTAARELLERLGADNPAQMAPYVRDIKPYLLPLDAFIQASVIDGDLNRTTGVLVVK